MLLKEAFRYQNYLTHLMNTASGYLCKESFVTSTVKTHYASLVDRGEATEEVTIPKSPAVSFTVNDVLDFAVQVLREKERLSEAISDVKKKLDRDLDGVMSLNKVKHDFIYTLKAMASLRSSERQDTGTGYKFNNEGNQVTYVYPVKAVQTIDFDRTDVKNLIKKFSKEIDSNSIWKDMVEVSEKVDYEPKWDVDTPLEDILSPE